MDHRSPFRRFVDHRNRGKGEEHIIACGQSAFAGMFVALSSPGKTRERLFAGANGKIQTKKQEKNVSVKQESQKTVALFNREKKCPIYGGLGGREVSITWAKKGKGRKQKKAKPRIS